MFSKACEYAIRSAIYISAQSASGKRVSLTEVATKIESPEAFTSKILQNLVKHNVISSIKGPGGGFQVDMEKIKDIKLITIIEAFDNKILDQCSLGLSECSDEFPCPFHHKYKPIKEKLIHTFNNTSLADLLAVFKSGETFLRL